MAYGSIFPASYQPAMYQPQMVQPQQNNSPMIWVQGEAGAKSYLLAPNTTIPLWDSEDKIIYLKSTDASGMPSMKVLDYTIRDTSAPKISTPVSNPNSDYVTHEELRALEEKIAQSIADIKEAKNESHATNANGRTAKKQSTGDAR